MSDSDKSRQELIQEIETLRSHQAMLEDRLANVESLEEQLHEARNQYVNLFESAGDSIFVIDLETLQIRDANENASRRLGYTHDELLDRSIEDIEILPSQPATTNFEWRSTYSGTRIYECEYRRGDGSTIPVEVSSRLVRYGNQEVLLNFVRDITQRKEAEQQRLDLEMERERATVLEQFITGASHDLRTPLSVMTMALYVLKQSPDEDKQRHYITVLHEQVARLSMLFEDMLAMVRLDGITEFDYQSVDVNDLVRQVIPKYQVRIDEAAHELITQFASDLPRIEVDLFHLSRVVSALLANAVAYTGDGGTITVRTRQEHLRLILEVEDTGIGISEDDLPHIFDRFFRVDEARGTEKGGAGLGLAIAKKIVDIHHGTIDVESKLDVGSIFRVGLPLERRGS